MRDTIQNPEPWEYRVDVLGALSHPDARTWDRVAWAMQLDLWGALKVAQSWARHGWAVRVTKADR